MTTNDLVEDDAGSEARARFEANLQKVERLSQRIAQVLSNKREVPTDLQGPSQELYLKAGAAYFNEMIHNPAKVFEQQLEYWGKSVAHFLEAQTKLAQGKLEAPEDHTPDDSRFSNPLWKTHPYFNYLKQQYMIGTQTMQNALAEMDGVSDVERKRLQYFGQQIMDMMAPTNFLGTNPDALERAIETEGQSLIDGLENLVQDLEANNGELVVTLADKSAFSVGENIGTTPGKVVFRNHMFELIQYSPTTETVHEMPLLIFPPWINRFYILDLKPQNSLIKWIVDQGYTLFVVSWVNPDESYAQIGMDDYVKDGYLTAIGEVKAICNVEQINVVGYCIAGTTLSLTLALMKQTGDTSVNSATFFTTLTDFSDQGEVGVFLTNDFVDGIETEAYKTGVLDSFYMSRTFSFLRSNDLIYKPAIRYYMMGETPPAFDLLYWNGDGTNLPAKMVVEYLRGLCQEDQFAAETFKICGHDVSLSEVNVPLCAIACDTDHIAAWRSSYRGVQKMGSEDKTFILSGSGHIAGIVNPPTKVKYGHWTNPDLSLDPEDWKASAEQHEGSWWPLWNEWLQGRAGEQIPARMPGDSAHPALAEAPGTYVKSLGGQKSEG